MSSRPRRTSRLGRPRAIAALKVQGLFGHFDYTFPSPPLSGPLPSDLLILYGDNGSGKTTLLNLVFHTISAGNKHGHRNAIRKIAFRQFVIEFQDGSKITLFRESGIVGGYAVRVDNSGGEVLQTTFGLEREDRFATDEHDQAFIEFLKSLNQSVYFVSADRYILSDELPAEPDEPGEQLALPFAEQGSLSVEHGGYEVIRRHHLRAYRPEARRAPAVTQAMEVSRKFITDQVLGAARRGSESTHGIYSDIVRHLGTSRESPQEAGYLIKEELVETLHSLSTRSRNYARFGFTTELDVSQMTEAITASAEYQIPLIARVLRPYIEGTNARLDELNAIYTITSKVVDTLQTFYVGKSVHFNFRRGFVVRSTYDNKRIAPTQLSSGEQQLLLLFCYALVSSDINSVFIIDEPELSLNIKWQRLLLGALLDIVSGGRVQFVFATHSVDLIGEHLEHVLKLEGIGAKQLGRVERERDSTNN